MKRLLVLAALLITVYQAHAQQLQQTDEQAQIHREAEERAEQMIRERDAAQVQKEKEEAFRNSPAGKRAAAKKAAEEWIKLARVMIQLSRQAMAKERRIGATTGYVDAKSLHDTGNGLEYWEGVLEMQWRIYKANGGQAASVSEIK